MPLYCFRCEKCNSRWEDFTKIGGISSCPSCQGYTSVTRDYPSETKVFLDDIPPYFDFSIGEHVTGRRDKLTKYKMRGLIPMYNKHGGDITTQNKSFYGDEEYRLQCKAKTAGMDLEHRHFEELIDKGISESEVD